jgi:glyoxylase-like metal-dependent hydrolase (beta-lactamase superfamily II)
MTASQSRLPTSAFFRLEQLGDGIYHAVATPGSGSLGNAGIIDLGGQTLIFDTMMTSAAARDLRAAAERLTGRAPRYVVNSHLHIDHTLGNGVFDEAKARAEAAAASDSAVRLDMEQQNDDYLVLLREADQTHARPPDVTFESRLTIHGARRQAQLFSWGGGHTPSDAVLYLPTERILFSGDLIFYRCHASIDRGDPAEWLRILDEMERLDLATLAPGHGEVTSQAAIAEQREYLEAMLARALQTIEASETDEQIAAAPLPAEYRDYGFASGFAQTLLTLAQYQRARVGGESQP